MEIVCVAAIDIVEIDSTISFYWHEDEEYGRTVLENEYAVGCPELNNILHVWMGEPTRTISLKQTADYYSKALEAVLQIMHLSCGVGHESMSESGSETTAIIYGYVCGRIREELNDYILPFEATLPMNNTTTRWVDVAFPAFGCCVTVCIPSADGDNRRMLEFFEEQIPDRMLSGQFDNAYVFSNTETFSGMTSYTPDAHGSIVIMVKNRPGTNFDDTFAHECYHAMCLLLSLSGESRTWNITPRLLANLAKRLFNGYANLCMQENAPKDTETVDIETVKPTAIKGKVF